MTSVTSQSEMIKGPHWAIIRYSSVYHAADQRSQDNPGHGYPAYSENIVKYEAFLDQFEWQEQVREYTRMKENFTAAKVIPAKITTEINVEVE